MHAVLCVGANTDIADNLGETPLQVAHRKWKETSNPGMIQTYEQVHDDTLNIIHFNITNALKEIFYIKIFYY